MTVLPATADRIRLTGPAATKIFLHRIFSTGLFPAKLGSQSACRPQRADTEGREPSQVSIFFRALGRKTLEGALPDYRAPHRTGKLTVSGVDRSWSWPYL